MLLFPTNFLSHQILFLNPHLPPLQALQQKLAAGHSFMHWVIQGQKKSLTIKCNWLVKINSLLLAGWWVLNPKDNLNLSPKN